MTDFHAKIGTLEEYKEFIIERERHRLSNQYPAVLDSLRIDQRIKEFEAYVADSFLNIVENKELKKEKKEDIMQFMKDH